jgi:hypothetical protein
MHLQLGDTQCLNISLTRDGDKYAGEYSYDEETRKISGCPARASAVEKFMKAIKTKSNVKGSAATREHAEAMTLEELQKIMQWSETQCPHEILEREHHDLETLKLAIKHGLMRAFSPSGYTLWTR